LDDDMILMPRPCADAVEPADVGADRLVRQRQRIERDARFGERKRGQDLIAERLRRDRAGDADVCGFPVTLISCEEERAIAFDRAAERSAELIEFHRRLRETRREETIARRELVA